MSSAAPTYAELVEALRAALAALETAGFSLNIPGSVRSPVLRTANKVRDLLDRVDQ